MKVFNNYSNFTKRSKDFKAHSDCQSKLKNSSRLCCSNSEGSNMVPSIGTWFSSQYPLFLIRLVCLIYNFISIISPKMLLESNEFQCGWSHFYPQLKHSNCSNKFNCGWGLRLPLHWNENANTLWSYSRGIWEEVCFLLSSWGRIT